MFHLFPFFIPRQSLHWCQNWDTISLNKELTYAAFGKITKEIKDVWTKAEHVVKIVKEYCKENCIDRSVIEPIIIDFCDDDTG